jgi:hypothetical protein
MAKIRTWAEAFSEAPDIGEYADTLNRLDLIDKSNEEYLSDASVAADCLASVNFKGLADFLREKARKRSKA